jgi:hypothetical protein
VAESGEPPAEPGYSVALSTVGSRPRHSLCDAISKAPSSDLNRSDVALKHSFNLSNRPSKGPRGTLISDVESHIAMSVIEQTRPHLGAENTRWQGAREVGDAVDTKQSADRVSTPGHERASVGVALLHPGERSAFLAAILNPLH